MIFSLSSKLFGFTLTCLVLDLFLFFLLGIHFQFVSSCLQFWKYFKSGCIFESYGDLHKYADTWL